MSDLCENTACAGARGHSSSCLEAGTPCRSLLNIPRMPGKGNRLASLCNHFLIKTYLLTCILLKVTPF